MRPPQSGRTKIDVTARIWFQISFSTSRMFTAASYQSRPSDRRSDPTLGRLARVALLGRRAAPGLPDGRSVSAGSPSLIVAGVWTGRAPRAGRGLPTDGERNRPAPSRPSSHAEPAVRAPRSRDPWRRSRSSVTTRSTAEPSAPSSIRDVVDHREDDLVGRPSTAVADDQPGRDALVPEAALRRPVEDELDRRGGRDRAAEPSDERGRRRGIRPGSGGLRDGVEQVRAVDQQAPGGGERVAVGVGHRRHRTRPGRTATIGRWASSSWSTSTASSTAAREPVPGVAAVLADRAARGDDVVYVTNNSMHYRADYQTRLAAMGAPVSPDTVVSSARATAVYLHEHDPGIRRVLVLGASGLERELRDAGYDVVTAGTAATRMSQEPHRRVRRRRQPRRGRRRARPEPDLRAARRGVGFASAPEPTSSRPTATRSTRPSAGCDPAPGRSSSRWRPRPASCRSRSASPPRTCSRPPRTRSVANPGRRS